MWQAALENSSFLLIEKSSKFVSNYCGSDGRSIIGLPLGVDGHRLVMNRKRDVVLFDQVKHGFRVDNELARRAFVDDEDDTRLDFFQSKKVEREYSF